MTSHAGSRTPDVGRIYNYLLGSSGHRRAGMADHHPVTPSGLGRGDDPFRRNRSP
jgi:hypothetical protein